MRKSALFAVLVTVGILPACAQDDPIVTDRPDFTEAAVTVGKGRLQIESGITGVRARGGVRELATEVLFRYGTSARAEVRLGLPAYNRITGDGPDLSGFGDTYAGAKFQLGPTKHGLDISIIPAVFLPTGKRDLSSRTVDPEVKLCLAKGLTERIGLSGMVYVSYPTVNDERNTTLQNTLSMTYALTEKLGSFYEVVGTFPRRGGAEYLFHPGMTYQPTPNTQWDIHIAFGLNDNAPVSFIAGGYSIRF